MSPSVSLITVTYNSVASLPATLDSVRKQSYADMEYIIVDGASSDGTVKLCEEQADLIDQMVSEPDDGLYDAMNKGLALANGEYVWYLNSDDRLASDAISRLLKPVHGGQDGKSPDIIHGGVRRFDKAGALSLDVLDRSALWTTHRGCSLPISMPFNHPATVIRRTLMQRLGGFDTAFRISADFDLFWRALQVRDIRVEHVNEVITHMALGGTSETWRHQIERAREDAEIRAREFPRARNLWITVRRLIRATLRSLAHEYLPFLDDLYRSVRRVHAQAFS